MSLPPFAVDQRWSVKTNVPSTLSVVVGRIETLPGDYRVVHVSLCDVAIPAGMPGPVVSSTSATCRLRRLH